VRKDENCFAVSAFALQRSYFTSSVSKANLAALQRNAVSQSDKQTSNIR
jgi:hypothetical protein